MAIEWVTAAELARRLEIHRQKIYKLTSTGKIPRRKKDKKINFEKAKKIILQGRELNLNVTDKTKSPPPEAPPKSYKNGKYKTIAEARLSYESYRARLAELEYKKQLGELIPAKDIVLVCQKIISATRTKLLAIPVKISPLLIGVSTTKGIKQIIQEAIYKSLDELSKLENVRK